MSNFIFRHALIFSMIGLVLGDTIISIILKLVPYVEVNDKKFRHPYFLTLWFFVGQIFCMLFYYKDNLKLRRKYDENLLLYPEIKIALSEGKKPYLSKYIIIFPAIMDILRTAFYFIAIAYVPASVINMMGALVVLVTTILDLFLLAKNIHAYYYARHHVLGLMLIVLGICLVNIALFVYCKTEDHHNDDITTEGVILGVSMMGLSALTQGLQMVSEKIMFEKYHITPMRLIGWEGIWGTIFCSLLLVVAQFIPGDHSLCSNGRLEDSLLAFKEIFQNVFLIVSIVSIMLSGFSMNLLGVFISKIGTATHRATVTQLKIVLVWAWFLIFNQYGTKETFLWLQLVGFIILTFGVLIFNEIMTIPLFGGDKYTKKKLGIKTPHRPTIDRQGIKINQSSLSSLLREDIETSVEES